MATFFELVNFTKKIPRCQGKLSGLKKHCLKGQVRFPEAHGKEKVRLSQFAQLVDGGIGQLGKHKDKTIRYQEENTSKHNNNKGG